MSSISPHSYPTGFSWPLRLFLGVFVFDMLLHCALVATKAGESFEDHVSRYPKALPTEKERLSIAAGEHPDGATSYAERLWEAVMSLPEYFDPRPKDDTAAKIESRSDRWHYAARWYKTRADFLGHLMGVDQNWTMFSPNVGTSDTLGRFRLVFEDGTEFEVRTICDPPDLCRYSHWFEEKHLQVATKIHKDADARLGYSRMLALRHAKNESGARLVRIDVFRIHYDYPTVDDHAEEFLQRQTGPPKNQVYEPFWRYHVDQRRGERL